MAKACQHCKTLLTGTDVFNVCHCLNACCSSNRKKPNYFLQAVLDTCQKATILVSEIETDRLRNEEFIQQHALDDENATILRKENEEIYAMEVSGPIEFQVEPIEALSAISQFQDDEGLDITEDVQGGCSPTQPFIRDFLEADTSMMDDTVRDIEVPEISTAQSSTWQAVTLSTHYQASDKEK